MKKRVFACVLSALLLVSVLSGCQKEEAPQEVGGIGSQGTTVEKQPIAGGELVIGTLQDLDDSLEPYEVTAEAREILFNVYEGLVKADATGAYVPAVASDSTVSEDGLTYTFPLREGVTFHNGEAVTAEDVIASFSACAERTEDAGLAEALANVVRVSSQEKGITITLRQADPDFLSYVSLVYITPEEANQGGQEDLDDQDPLDDRDSQDGQRTGSDRAGQSSRLGQTNQGSRYDRNTRDETGSRPVGTGPFQLAQEADSQGDLVLERFDGYWGEKAYLDKVTFQEFSTTSQLMAAMDGGAVDMVLHLPQAQLDSVSAGVYKILEGSRNQVQALYLNNAVEPFDNEKVRQAICYGVNVDGILAQIGAGSGTRVSSPFSSAFSGFYDESLKDSYAHDTERAKELLAEIGFEEGFSMTITVPDSDPIHETVAEVIAEQLEEVGIQATVRTVSQETWEDTVYTQRDFESTVVSFDTAVFSPGALLDPWISDSQRNFIGYADPQYDSLVEEAATASQEEQTDLYQQAVQRLVESGTGVYIQDLADYAAVRTYVDGYQFYPLRALNLAGLYYVEAPQTPEDDSGTE